MKYRLLLMMVVLCFSATEIIAQAVPAKAITNVTIHHSDGNVTEGATIVWRNNRIEQAGSNVSVPFDAKVVLDGGDTLHVYAGFINGYTTLGSPDLPRQQPRADVPGQPGYDRAGIQPQQKPYLRLESGSRVYKQWQDLGFTTAAVALDGYMLPGSVDIFSLQEGDTPDFVVRRGIAQFAQFRSSGGVYPSTLMGMMAQMRQLWYNAEAFREHQNLYASNQTRHTSPGHNPVYEALYPVMDKQVPLFFKVDSQPDINRVIKLSEELGFNTVIVSGKEAWRAADQLRAKNIPVLVSVDFPDKPDFMKKEEDDDDEENGLSEEATHFQQRQQEAWETHMNGISTLLNAGVKVGFTSDGIDNRGFWKNVRLLGEHGLTEAQILEILTSGTAEILGKQQNYGSVTAGYTANFIVTTHTLLNKDLKISAAVSGGKLTKN